MSRLGICDVGRVDGEVRVVDDALRDGGDGDEEASTTDQLWHMLNSDRENRTRQEEKSPER
jgi:hypothetical protein